MHGPSIEGGDEAIAQINIIPLVDVVLVLLIIFMVTTVFIRDSAMKLDLPQGTPAQATSVAPFEITVLLQESGAITVNNQPVQLGALQQTVADIQSKHDKVVLVLRGAKSVKYKQVLPVLDAVSRTGVKVTLGQLSR